MFLDPNFDHNKLKIVNVLSEIMNVHNEINEIEFELVRYTVIRKGCLTELKL